MDWWKQATSQDVGSVRGGRTVRVGDEAEDGGASRHVERRRHSVLPDSEAGDDRGDGGRGGAFPGA